VQTRGLGWTRDHGHGCPIEYGGGWALTPSVTSTASLVTRICLVVDDSTGGSAPVGPDPNGGNHRDWISQSEGRRNLGQQKKEENGTSYRRRPLMASFQRRQGEGGRQSGGYVGGVGEAYRVASGDPGGRAGSSVT
jgi:hypothetical protein